MNFNDSVISFRKVPESRPFDIFYDIEYYVPTSKNFYKLVGNAIEETAEQDVQPIYGSMFSDVRRFPKLQCVLKTEIIPISWEEKYEKKAKVKLLRNNDEVCGRDRYKFISKPNVDMPIKIKFENFMKSSAHKISINSIGENETMKIRPDNIPKVIPKQKCSKSTQTDYRDSETQTDPWIPPYDEKLNSLLFLKPEQGSLIEYEISTLEEKRKIKELEKTLLEVDKRNLKTQIAITKKIEHITWLIKEKKMDCINTTRITLAENAMNKKSLLAQTSIKQREDAFRNSQIEWKTQKTENVMRYKERIVRKLQQSSHSEICSYHFKSKFDEEIYSSCRKDNK